MLVVPLAWILHFTNKNSSINYKYNLYFGYAEFKLPEISVEKKKKHTLACALHSNYSVESFCSDKYKYCFQAFENYDISSDEY